MSLELFETLEAKIRETVDRLLALSEQNAQLERRVTELERELELERAKPTDEAESGWRAEREELRRRVEKLVALLEELNRDPG